MDTNTTIIVPAYNEHSGILMMLKKLETVVDEQTEVVVVDDGSTDGTGDIALQYSLDECPYSIRVLVHASNAGKGKALLTGLDAAHGKNVLWIDADDTYPTDPIPTMVRMLDNGFQAVVCSRRGGRAYIPKFNRIGLWLFRILIQGVYGFRAYDPCTGLYGVHRTLLRQMRLTSHRFAIEPEVSIKAGRMRLRTLDIAIEYRRRVGGTKLNAIKVGFEDMWTIMKLVFWRP